MSSPADPPLDDLLSRMKWVRHLASALVQDADQADDLVQDAWRLALERPPQKSVAWRSWIAQVMRNRVVNHWQSNTRRKPLNARLPQPEEVVAPDETVQRLETQQALGEAVKGLPEPYRSTVLLHYFEGWSLRQIAVAEGVQVRSIETRMRRGRDLIRTSLEKRGSAEHWAVGLLMLSRRTPPPALVLNSVAAAALLAASGMLAWWAWPDQSTDTMASPGIAHSTNPSSAGLVAASSPPELVQGSIERAEVASEGRALRLSVIDAATRQPLSGVQVQGEFMDSENRSLRTLEWVSSAPASEAIPIPAGAEQIRLVTAPSHTHAGQLGGALYSWKSGGTEPLILIPSERLRGEILGQVLDLTGKPVPGSEVGLWLKRQEGRGLPPDRRFLTGPDGSFALPLEVAREADLFLAPIAPGYSALRCYRLSSERPANAYVEKLELLLAPGRELDLTILDEAGAPIAGAEVIVWPSRRSDLTPVFPVGQYEGQVQHHLRTDEIGRVPILLLDHERHSLAVRHPNHTPVSLELPAGSDPLTLRLGPAAQLMGRILTPEGAPAADVRVIAHGSESFECQTDSDGRFSLVSPSPAQEEFFLILAPPAPFALQVLGPMRHGELPAELEFQLEAGLSLVARLVTPDGKLCANVPGLRAELSGGPTARTLNADHRSQLSWTEFLPQTPASPFQEVQAAELRVSGLPAAQYQVSFWGREGLLAQASLEAGSEPIDLIIGTYPDARAVLSGTLRRAGTDSAVSQFQFECQRLASPDPEDRLQEQISMAYSSTDGTFRCEGIPPGWWQLRIFGPEPGCTWGMESVLLRPGEHLELAPFLDEPVDGTLRVLDAEGQPAPDLRIRLLDSQGRACAFGAPARFHDRTDAQGNLFLQRLPGSMDLKVELSARDGHVWTMPAGTLDLRQNSWLLRLPD